MSDQKRKRVFFPSSSEDQNTDGKSNNRINYHSIPPISDDQLSLWLQNAPSNFASINYSIEDVQAYGDHISSFEIPSSTFLESQKVNSGDEIPCLEDINGQSSGITRKDVSDSLETQTKGSHEAGAKEDPKARNECKQQKRRRSTKIQNVNERLRRQKFRQKLQELQEMIPNSTKRDQASTLDNAIKYIKTLQYQFQMTSIGAGGYTMFHSPMIMMPRPGHQGFQIPSLAPFLHNGSDQISEINEIKHETETRMLGAFSSFDFPMSQLGLSNPCISPSSSTSGLPPHASGIDTNSSLPFNSKSI